MRKVAIAALVAGWILWGAAFPVIPLVSSPDYHAYLAEVPGILAAARARIWAALSDCRRYEDGTTDPLLAALAQAAGRGVEVRVLLERREEFPSPEQLAAWRWLKDQGVKVKWDPPETTLHAKFILADDRLVVGSTHWTKSALTRSVQVDAVIDSPELAQAATQFFQLLWEGKLKAKGKLPALPWPEDAVAPLLDLPGSQLNLTAAKELIAGAKEEIDLLLYELFYYPQYRGSPANALFEGLLSALKRGVRVRVLLEAGEDFDYLREGNALSASLLKIHGGAVRLDGPDSTMHAKCLLVDGRGVLISSANWTYSSLLKNVEAGVAFLDAPALATKLKRSFAALWQSGWQP